MRVQSSNEDAERVQVLRDNDQSLPQKVESQRQVTYAVGEDVLPPMLAPISRLERENPMT